MHIFGFKQVTLVQHGSSFPSKKHVLEEAGACTITCRCGSLLERTVAGNWQEFRVCIAIKDSARTAARSV